MRVVIDISVAEDPATFPWLIRIQQLFEDEWHLWEIPDVDAMLATAWLADLGHTGSSARDVLVKTVVRSAYPTALHRARVRITVSPQGALELTPEDGSRFLVQPLVVLLENRESDGAFLDAIVDTLGDDELRKHWRLIPAPVVKDSRGGKGEMARHVELEASRRPRSRLFVICDRDGETPTSPVPATDRLRETCERLDFPCWVLAKREAENYLPETLLLRAVGSTEERQKKLEAWRRLTVEKKDFYDLKDGFCSLKTDEGRDFFSSLQNPDDRQLLRDGFGESLATLWKIRPIDAADLKNRSGNELAELLGRLCELL